MQTQKPEGKKNKQKNWSARCKLRNLKEIQKTMLQLEKTIGILIYFFQLPHIIS